MPNEITTPEWLIYERCVAAFVQEGHSGIYTTVLPNVSLIGEISGERRQIDVLIENRWQGGASSRIIVDAKKRSRPVDIRDVEAFEGMMRDCRATRGIIVCTSGWTDGAVKRAKDAVTITLLEFEKALDEYDWNYEECLASCPDKSGRGGVLWGEWMPTGIPIAGSTPLMPLSGVLWGEWIPTGWIILQVGKCDGCHSFHVWCQDCGDKFAITDSTVVTCGCDGREWASVPESAESGHIGKPESIWLMMREDGNDPIAIDRRPLR